MTETIDISRYAVETAASMAVIVSLRTLMRFERVRDINLLQDMG